jgi:hypothetical protein
MEFAANHHSATSAKAEEKSNALVAARARKKQNGGTIRLAKGLLAKVQIDPPAGRPEGFRFLKN